MHHNVVVRTYVLGTWSSNCTSPTYPDREVVRLDGAVSMQQVADLAQVVLVVVSSPASPHTQYAHPFRICSVRFGAPASNVVDGSSSSSSSTVSSIGLPERAARHTAAHHLTSLSRRALSSDLRGREEILLLCRSIRC